MHFEIKIPENSRKNIFGDNQTINKVALIFLYAKVLTVM